MLIERKDLVQGRIYFMDNSKNTKGVFKGRDEDTIYFDCDENSPYGKTIKDGRAHLTPFHTEGDGFLEVLLGDGLTDEDVQLLNSVTEVREFKVGDKVKVLKKGSSNNPEGSIGVITEVDDQTCMRVKVEGFTDDNLINWQSAEELELIQQ